VKIVRLLLLLLVIVGGVTIARRMLGQEPYPAEDATLAPVPPLAEMP